MGGFFNKKPQASMVPDASSGSHFPNDNPSPSIVRDFGMQSRTVREALEVLQEAAPTLPGLNLFMDQHGFRSISQSIRDLNEQARMSILNRAEWVSLFNALGSRGMQIRTDLIVSEGFKPNATSTNPEFAARVQSVLDDHWDANEWDERLYNRILDLGTTGELIRRVPPLGRDIKDPRNHHNSQPFLLSRFRCGNILPHLVQKITVDPWNYEDLDEIFLHQYAFPTGSPLRLKIAKFNHTGLKRGDITGDVFYVSVNRRPGASRGISDLAPALEWLDLHDQSLFSDCERAAMMMRFIWDVTLTNASPGTIKNYLAELKQNPIKTATVRVHSDKEVWDAISPDLRLAETNGLREDIFLKAWGSMGLPRHWFVEAEDTNRSTGERMEGPIFSWARSRKKQVSKFLEFEHRYAVQVARDAGALQGIPEEHLEISMESRDPDRSNYEALATALGNLSSGLTTLVSSELMDKIAAADIVRTVAGSYGVELPKLENVPNAPSPLLASPPGPATMASPGAVNPAQTENPYEAMLTEALDKGRRVLISKNGNGKAH